MGVVLSLSPSSSSDCSIWIGLGLRERKEKENRKGGDSVEPKLVRYECSSRNAVP